MKLTIQINPNKITGKIPKLIFINKKAISIKKIFFKIKNKLFY
jgi:hypothetical protein